MVVGEVGITHMITSTQQMVEVEEECGEDIVAIGEEVLEEAVKFLS